MNRFCFRSLPVFFLAALLAAGDKNDFKPNGSGIVISEQYSGKNRDKAKEVLTLLKDHKIPALKTIHQQLGFTKPIKIPIRVADSATVKGALAETGGFGGQVTMVFCLDEIIRTDKDKQDIELTYIHELVHAYLRQYITASNYELIPRWLQEGVAVYGAAQTDDRIEREMKRDPNDPMAFVKKMEAEKQKNPGYIESSLIFEYIHKKHGEAKVKQFAEGLMSINSAKNLQQIVQAATGEAYAGFMANARAFAVEYVRKKIQELQKKEKK